MNQFKLLSRSELRLFVKNDLLLDRIDQLTLYGNDSFDDLRAIYDENEALHAPADWLPQSGG